MRSTGNRKRWIVAVAFVCVMVSPVFAQFRELTPSQPKAKAFNRNLKLTKERFKAPVVNKVTSTVKKTTESVKTFTDTTPKAIPLDLNQPAERVATKPRIDLQPEPAIISELETIPDPVPEPAPLLAAPELPVVEVASLPAPPVIEEVKVQPTIEAPITPVVAAEEEVVVETPAQPVQPPKRPFASFSEGAQEKGQFAPNPSQIKNIHATKFNEAEPGVTTIGEIRRMWGEPARTIEEEESVKLIYHVPGFRQVDVVLDEEGIVSSMLVHLSQPIPVAQASKELGLLDFAPVPIPDEYGLLLGQGYPERGIMYSYAAGQPGVAVERLILEPITGEMFRMRAEHDFDRQYQRDLADLSEAIRRDPLDAHAHWLRSQILATTGRYASAMDSVNEAVRLAPEAGIYQLTRARLLALTGEYERGIAETKQVINNAETPAEVAARGETQLGDLLIMGDHPDYQEAMKHHLRAIDLAAKVIDERRFGIRRLAKKVLVDAHLAVAMDVALGNFQRQDEVVPKWLMRATEIAEQFITQDNGDKTMRMDVYRTSLAAFGVLQGKFDANIAAEEAIAEGRRLIADAADPIYQQRIERSLAETLFHAVKLERAKGQLENGIRYANNSLALLKNLSSDHASNEHDQYLEGQLYFLVGSLYAVQDSDHSEAVEWYTRALPKLNPPHISFPWLETNDLGEIFVSMGVSYWASGAKEKAIRLTQRGANLMQQSVEIGTLEQTAMAIPFGNLATMHGKLGHTKESNDFAKMASKLEAVLKQEQDGTITR